MAATSALEAVPVTLPRPARARQTLIPQLDGLRGVAILLVLSTHVFALHLAPTAGIDGVVRQVTHVGWTGVDLFFVLSGFLITGGLIDTKGRPRYWTGYLARRCLRIFPLYYGALAFVFLLLPRLVDWPDPGYAVLRANQAWYWAYAVNLLQAIHGTAATPLNTAHFWSLSIEEQFYLFWPLVVWAVPARRLPVLAAGMIGFGVLFRIFVCGTPGLGPIAAYVLTPGRLDGLMIGAGLAAALRHGGLERLRAPAIATGLVSATVLAAMMAVRGTDYEDPVIAIAGFPLVAAFFGSLLTLALTSRGTLRALLSSPRLRAWGKYSYGIYLLHYPLIGVLDDKLGVRFERMTLGGSHLPGVIALSVVALPLSFGVAWLSYHLYEKRFLALKRYFR
jgi:peptidoglycan/LPS O-acetylase OafA/YrhL